MQGVEGALPNSENSLQKAEEDAETLEQKIDLPVGNISEASREPISASNHVNIEVKSEFDLGLQEQDVKEKPLSEEGVKGSDSPLPSKVKVALMESGSSNGELKFVDTKCGPLLSYDDMSSRAMMPESIVSGLVNLCRIHRSPRSTH
ncbi:hypothetical protein Salat_0711300 [Sesamum alatum]|uniref:Uncharacterized protein n=1 Tax=Sesamum alatum TaxID=300844 RepID=A0AAE1YS36_9LAMI|nr:hypothetical protein Salat_0711300 [Sesamum alatum]